MRLIGQFPKPLGALLISFALTLGSTTARADIVTFQLTYSGAGFSNSATGSGFISFDDSVLPNTVVNLNNVSPATLGIVDFGITISNALAGNGSFGLADFAADPDHWVWSLSNPLDFSMDLVGQAGFHDFNWCANGSSCGSATAPGGLFPFTILTDGENGYPLRLTSMLVVNAVPEPGSLALLGLGLAGLAAIRGRKQA